MVPSRTLRSSIVRTICIYRGGLDQGTRIHMLLGHTEHGSNKRTLNEDDADPVKMDDHRGI